MEDPADKRGRSAYAIQVFRRYGGGIRIERKDCVVAVPLVTQAKNISVEPRARFDVAPR